MTPPARKRLQRFVRAAGIGLVLIAVAKELRTPREVRTWQGRIAGVIPYDFRMPTIARFRERMWAPEDTRILTPQTFGVGWTVNVGRLVALLRRPRG